MNKFFFIMFVNIFYLCTPVSIIEGMQEQKSAQPPLSRLISRESNSSIRVNTSELPPRSSASSSPASTTSTTSSASNGMGSAIISGRSRSSLTLTSPMGSRSLSQTSSSSGKTEPSPTGSEGAPMSESSSASQSARTSPGVKPVNAFSATQAQISAATVTAVMAYSNLQKLTGSQHNSPRTIPRPSTPNLGMPSSTGTGEILSADPNSPRMLQAYLEKRIEEALGQVAEANQSVAHLVSKNRALEKEVTALRAQKETKDTGTQTDVVDCSTPEDDIEV